MRARYFPHLPAEVDTLPSYFPVSHAVTLSLLLLLLLSLWAWFVCAPVLFPSGDGTEGAGTALQLTRALLSKEGAGPRKKGLQEVARQLSAAVAANERAKELRERKEREAKVSLEMYRSGMWQVSRTTGTMQIASVYSIQPSLCAWWSPRPAASKAGLLGRFTAEYDNKQTGK